jgi:hypothetical protein
MVAKAGPGKQGVLVRLINAFIGKAEALSGTELGEIKLEY